MFHTKLSNQLFYSLLVAKLITMLWAWFQWDTGGFKKEEMLLVVAMLLPLFSIYASFIIKYWQVAPTIIKTQQPRLRVSTWFMFSIFLHAFLPRKKC